MSIKPNKPVITLAQLKEDLKNLEHASQFLDQLGTQAREIGNKMDAVILHKMHKTIDRIVPLIVETIKKKEAPKLILQGGRHEHK